MARRFLVTVLLALVTAAATASANAGILADPFLPQEWWLAHIGADPAQAPGPGVPIVIVDSGTDPTHPEFAGRPNTRFLNEQTTSGREEFHGTEVASVAAAPDNGVGLVGVYPNAALEIFDASPSSQGITDPTAVTGVLAAAQLCPAVINLSFGGTQQDPELQDAVLTALRNGCLVVAASGNGGETGNPTTYPASWPHVLAVGATDENDVVASFSTTGAAVDVVAPGVGIIGAVPLTRNSTGYQSPIAGTSFSAPIVAAAAAWVWTVRPTLTAGQVAQVLKGSARDLGPPGFDTTNGWGLINIPAALAAPTPAVDPAEPNDDIKQVAPGRLFASGQATLTAPAKPSTRVAGTLDASDDPRDVYRIWIPAKKVVRVAVTDSNGAAAARIWGPQAVAVNEGLKLRRRDLRGPTMVGGKKGANAYVEVLLTGRRTLTGYTLAVTASSR